MKETAPKSLDYYKSHYASAKRGNYDIYVVFVEKAINLINKNGKLGYILPHKFFNAKYGQSLRDLIKENKLLDKIVHFRDIQIFENATTYTCLLFLDYNNSQSFDFYKVEDLKLLNSNEFWDTYDYDDMDNDSWTFLDKNSRRILKKINQTDNKKLNNLAKIFVGIQTSADNVYILKCIEKCENYSKYLNNDGNEIILESDLFKPFLKNIKDKTFEPYMDVDSEYELLFPYKLEMGKAIPLTLKEIKKYPKTYDYLLTYKKDLLNRSNIKSNNWWYFSRHQNLSMMEEPKLIIPVLSLYPRLIYDDNGFYMTGGGGGPFYGLRPGNVIGYVAIDEDLNKNLKDKTDREGLIDNDYYRSFYRVNLEIIRRINEAMQIIRRTYNEYIDKCQQQGAVKTYNQAVKRIEDTARKGSSLMTDFKNANNEIATLRKKVDAINKDNGGLFEADLQAKEETLQQTSTVLTRYSDLLQQALEVLESAPELKESIEIIIPMVEQMRSKLDEVLSLASLGLVSEMVSHDMGQITTRLLDKSKKLSKRISGNNPVEKQEVLLLIEHIRTAVSSIRSQLKHLDTSFKYNKEKKDVISLSELLIVDEKKFYQEKIDLMGFNFWVDIQAEFSIFVNKGKMIQVFDNLINNSLYWLKKCYDSEGKSGLVMKATIKSPYVYFEDNGWGVDKLF